jgi:hypothetical protein
MLTRGAFNIIGADEKKRAEIEKAQTEVAAAVDGEITRLGIEHDKDGTSRSVPVKTRKRLRAHKSNQRAIIYMPPSTATENCFWAIV